MRPESKALWRGDPLNRLEPALESGLVRVEHREVSTGTSALANDVSRTILASRPENTLRAYSSALRYWDAWHQIRYGCSIALPTPVEVVLQFIVDHKGVIERDGDNIIVSDVLPDDIKQALIRTGRRSDSALMSRSNLDIHLAALSAVHAERNLPSPRKIPVVLQLLKSINALSSEMGMSPHKKEPVRGTDLDRMIQTCEDDLLGVRDRALLLFIWSSGGRRRSEASKAMVADFTFDRDGTGLFRMRRSKTFDRSPKPLNAEVVRALQDWMSVSGVNSGLMFRNLRGGKVGDSLSGKSIADIVKRRAASAGLVGDFAAHSLRRGFVCTAVDNRIPLDESMRMTGHTSVNTFIDYAKERALRDGEAASLLDLVRTSRKSSGQ